MLLTYSCEILLLEIAAEIAASYLRKSIFFVELQSSSNIAAQSSNIEKVVNFVNDIAMLETTAFEENEEAKELNLMLPLAYFISFYFLLLFIQKMSLRCCFV
jgi:hypothetical protein